MRRAGEAEGLGCWCHGLGGALAFGDPRDDFPYPNPIRSSPTLQRLGSRLYALKLSPNKLADIVEITNWPYLFAPLLGGSLATLLSLFRIFFGLLCRILGCKL